MSESDDLTTPSSMSFAEADGELAARAGRALKENPFPPGCEGHEDWSRGFIRARLRSQRNGT